MFSWPTLGSRKAGIFSVSIKSLIMSSFVGEVEFFSVKSPINIAWGFCSMLACCK